MQTLSAVIFDWAGTAVDFGSMAPVAAFAAAFASAGVPVSEEEIRRPMGLEKRRHVERILQDPEIARRWQRVHETAPQPSDVDTLYRGFQANLLETLPRFAQPVPGLLETIARLRADGVRIASNTGYSSRMMDVLAPAAREAGFVPDCIATSSDVTAGRPAPDLSWKCLELLGLRQDIHAVKVDDTAVGIEEGRNAGLWTVAVAVSGNEVGLPLAQWSALSPSKQSTLRSRAYARLRKSKADYIIDTVAQLADVILAINERIAAGDHPPAR